MNLYVVMWSFPELRDYVQIEGLKITLDYLAVIFHRWKFKKKKNSYV